jgi:polysaccharide biosynthesis protein PslH
MNIISLVSYPFLPARSGGQKGIALFYKYFSRYHSVTIVTTQKNQPSFADGYAVVNSLSNSPLRYINPFTFFTIRKQIREKKATHLILEHPYYGWLGFLLKTFCSVRLVVHSHNMEGNRWKSLGKWWWRILWSYEKFTHRIADYNFFIQDEDREYAILSFGLKKERCITVSFGTEIPEPPSLEKRQTANLDIRKQLDIPGDVPLLLFNGAFAYYPNREALENLLFKVNPILQNRGFSYLILICGLDIPETYLQAEFPSVRFLGFVEDLNLYLKGCRTFLNTVSSGGGIKTKLVEALAFDLNVVSTQNGAIGVDPGLCNGKLTICRDDDWISFADSVIQSVKTATIMPSSFYDQFYWANITRRAAEFIAVDPARAGAVDRKNNG